MLVKGQLEQAQLENLKADPANLPAGRTWIDTVAKVVKTVIDGAAKILVTTDQAQTLTNKSIDVDQNTVSNVGNANIKASAAIEVSKLEALATSRAAVTNGSGHLAASPVTATEIGLLAGKTGNLATTANAETFTNKTINGDNNTIEDVSLSSLKAIIGDADKFIVRDATGAVVSNKAVPNGQVVGTIGAQFVDDKILGGDTSFSAAPRYAEIATPTPPPSTFIKLYPKIDGSFYSLNSSGVETKIGAGAGTVNFIKNSDGDSTVGWNTYGAITGLPNASTDLVDLDFPVTIPVGTPVVYTTTGTNAAPLINGTTYYVVGSGSAYIQLATTLGGSVINITSAGTGTQRFRTATPYLNSGGTPINLSLSTSATDPLIGSSSFILTKTIATAMGEGYSYDFTIDRAYQASVLDINFKYLVNSGTFSAGSSNLLPGDIRVWILDVTNNVLIQPSSFGLLSNSTTIADTFQASFQSASNSTSYRLILHVGSASTPAWSLKMDGITVSPSKYVYGTPITDWVAFTPTGTWTTNTTYTGAWRRVGDSIEVQARATVSGAPTAAGLQINLPAGLSIDTAKTPLIGNNKLGFGAIRDSGGFDYPASVVIASATALSIQSSSTVAGSNPVGVVESGVTHVVPFTWASGDSVAVWFSAPILGWSSSVQMSDSYDGRVIAASGYGGNTADTLASNTDVTLPLSTVFLDTVGMVSGNTVVVKSAGKYRVKFTARMGSSNTNFTNTHSSRLLVNGAVALSQSIQGSGAYNAAINLRAFNLPDIDSVITLNACDVVSFAARSDMASNTFGFALGMWSVEKISGSTAIAANETITVNAYNTSGQSIPNNISTNLTNWTEIKDSHGAFNAATGVFTAPISGDYEMTFNSNFLFGFTANTGVAIGIITSSAPNQDVNQSVAFPNNNSNAFGVLTTGTFTLQAGQTLNPQMYQVNGVARSLSNDLRYNRLSIKRIGL